ncbi:MAG: hypothetical protein HC902_04915 [Calothrix sp. SM1_5_4]|nr:hypothetical protein [Calothrix sp. SM1_5_4]
MPPLANGQNDLCSLALKAPTRRPPAQGELVYGLQRQRYLSALGLHLGGLNSRWLTVRHFVLTGLARALNESGRPASTLASAADDLAMDGFFLADSL